MKMHKETRETSALPLFLSVSSVFKCFQCLRCSSSSLSLFLLFAKCSLMASVFAAVKILFMCSSGPEHSGSSSLLLPLFAS